MKQDRKEIEAAVLSSDVITRPIDIKTYIALHRLKDGGPVVDVIKVSTAVTYGRKASLTAVNSDVNVIKHFYGCILRHQSHLAA